MSFSGEIVFYTNRKTRDPHRWVQKCLEVADPQDGKDVSFIHHYTKKPDKTWKEVKKQIRNPMYIPRDDWDSSGETDTIDYDMISQYSKRGCVQVMLWSGDWMCLDQVQDEIDNIPEEIAGDFFLNGISIYVGKHDIFEIMENPEGLLVARPYLNFSLTGQGSPCDWEGMRETLLSLSVTKSIKKELETVAGPLETYAYWL